VCDANFLRRYGLGAIRPGRRSVDDWVRRRYLKRGASLEALAAEAGIDGAGLQSTVERMNASPRRAKTSTSARAVTA
jgi:hypothetical protein